jgi:hypothetical protein
MGERNDRRGKNMLSTLMISMWAGLVAGETPITVQQSTAQKQEDAKELKVLERA